jgi:hypothetical protein
MALTPCKGVYMNLSHESEQNLNPAENALHASALEAEAMGAKAVRKDYADYAAKIGMPAIAKFPHKHTQVLARNNGFASYRGPIVGQNEMFVVQKISPLNTVRHLKQDLPFVPQDGQNVRIGYSANVCRITDDMKLKLKRGLSW